MPSSGRVDPSIYNVYWFARDLIASNYGGYAKKEAENLQVLASILEARLDRDNADIDNLRQTIRDVILDSVDRTRGGSVTRRYLSTEDLVGRIRHRISTLDDIRSFIIAARAVTRTGEIIAETPSFGDEDIRRIVDEVLSGEGKEPDPSRAYKALLEVDLQGEAYQLGAQRGPLIEYVSELLDTHLADSDGTYDEAARIVSAVVQEYERRAGQSRSSTAGNVLEKALQRIFEQFGVPATGKPEHHGDLEIDNVVRGPEGSIGFSCKRTLRERFRQSLVRQSEIGVDEIWFVVLLTADVSREKLVDIQNDGGRIYVPQDTYVWKSYNGDGSVSYALRPADEFLKEVAEFTGYELTVGAPE